LGAGSGPGIAAPTIEDVLSHVRALRSLCGEGAIDDFPVIISGSSI